MTIMKTADKTVDGTKYIINMGILVVYGVLTLIGILNHELWIDEAQAWNIARDNDLPGLLKAMQYEGHPPLWHVILYVFAHMGLSCMALSVIEHIYYVYTYLWSGVYNNSILNENTIFMAEGGMKMYANTNFVCIVKVDINQLEEIAIDYNRYRNKDKIEE